MIRVATTTIVLLLLVALATPAMAEREDRRPIDEVGILERLTKQFDSLWVSVWAKLGEMPDPGGVTSPSPPPSDHLGEPPEPNG